MVFYLCVVKDHTKRSTFREHLSHDSGETDHYKAMEIKGPNAPSASDGIRISCCINAEFFSAGNKTQDAYSMVHFLG
jgi:hypothetical protein